MHDRPERAERLAQEDLDLEPGQFPESTQHGSSPLVADRVTGELQEHVLERRQHGAEVGDPDPVLGQALDDVGDEVVAPAANA